MIPFVQNQTGYIAGNMLESLGQRHEAEVERRKQDLGRVKAAEAFLKNTPSDISGLAPEDLAMMSGPDKLSHMVGVISAQKAKHDQAQLQALAEQSMAHRAQSENAGRFPAFAEDAGKYNVMGQLPYDMPQDQLSEYELPEGQTQPGPRELLRSMARSRFNPGADTDNLLRSMAQHQSPPIYPLGKQTVLPDGTVITGTGTTTPHIRNPDKPDKPVKSPPQNPLLVDKDAGIALGEAMKYTDPEERNAALEAVNKAQSAYGHPSVLERLMTGQLQAPAPTAATKPPAAVNTKAGTEANPHKPTKDSGLKGVKTGEYYIDPGDGQLYRKI